MDQAAVYAGLRAVTAGQKLTDDERAGVEASLERLKAVFGGTQQNGQLMEVAGALGFKDLLARLQPAVKSKAVAGMSRKRRPLLAKQCRYGVNPSAASDPVR